MQCCKRELILCTQLYCLLSGNVFPYLYKSYAHSRLRQKTEVTNKCLCFHLLVGFITINLYFSVLQEAPDVLIILKTSFYKYLHKYKEKLSLTCRGTETK